MGRVQTCFNRVRREGSIVGKAIRLPFAVQAVSLFDQYKRVPTPVSTPFSELKLVDKLPCLSRNPGFGLPTILFRRIMVTIKSTPAHRIALPTPLIRRTDVGAASRCRFGSIGRTTTIISHKPITYTAPLRNIQNGISNAMRTKISNRCRTSFTST